MVRNVVSISVLGVVALTKALPAAFSTYER
jgi:hypothetical protein